MKERENNIDLLRIICAIMVIALHTGAIYGKNISGEYPRYYFTIGNFYHSVTRTAVPIFIMLSGSFLLKNVNNMNYRYYYKKISKNIILPTLIFSFLYVLASLVLEFLLSNKNGIPFNLSEPFINWIQGTPFYHMWYMYMMIGFYAITPILIKIRLIIEDEKFEVIGWICMIFGMLFNLLSVQLIWPIQFIPYLGYFILGYSLKNKIRKKSYISYLILTVILLLSIFIITEFSVRYNLLKNNFYFIQPLSPLVILSSIFMYIAFLNMRNLMIRPSKIAYHTFNIYLLHAGVLATINMIIRRIFNKYPNPIWYIPILIIIVFNISYRISISINKIIEKFKIKKYN